MGPEDTEEDEKGVNTMNQHEGKNRIKEKNKKLPKQGVSECGWSNRDGGKITNQGRRERESKLATENT